MAQRTGKGMSAAAAAFGSRLLDVNPGRLLASITIGTPSSPMIKSIRDRADESMISANSKDMR